VDEMTRSGGEAIDGTLMELPVAAIVEGFNPRTVFDDEAMADLRASIKQRGVLNPILVRPRDDDGTYELIAGGRRFRACQELGRPTIPAIVRSRGDVESLEDAIVENLQRAAVRPLEEARAFDAALRTVGGSRSERLEQVQAIARRIGKPTGYVWDRLKLLDLIPVAQQLLDAGRITTDHAVRLARLTPAEQECVVNPKEGGLFQRDGGRYFEFENNRPDDEDWDHVPLDPYVPLKAVSLRELDAWIASHIRFNPQQAAVAAPLDFGSVAARVEEAAELPGRGKKVVHVTHDSFVRPEAKTNERVYCGSSWKRADGRRESETCDKSVLGLVVVGAEYGQAYPVCINKSCDVHWAKERKARDAARQAATPSVLAGSGGESSDAVRRREVQQQRKDAEAAFKAAMPAIVDGLVAILKKAEPLALAQVLVDSLWEYDPKTRKEIERRLPVGKTAADVLRRAALYLALNELDAYDSELRFGSWAKKRFGFDVEKVLKAQAKPAAAAARPKPKPKTAKKAATKGRAR
jgi:ParB/RepB/Spo0J family partition protein